MDLIRSLARFGEFIMAGLGGPTFWTISTNGQVVGSIVREAGEWRLSWFENADPRLRSYRGPVPEDLSVLSEALSTRLGAPVSFDTVIG